MRSTLKTTTAVLACLNLAFPLPALAQDAGGNAADPCTDPESQACLDATQGGAADGAGATDPEPEAVPEQPAPEQQPAPEEPAPEPEAAPEQQPAPDAEAAPEQQSAPEQEATPDEPAPEPEAATEQQPAPEAEAAPEQQPAPEADAATDDAPEGAEALDAAPETEMQDGSDGAEGTTGGGDGAAGTGAATDQGEAAGAEPPVENGGRDAAQDEAAEQGDAGQQAGQGDNADRQGNANRRGNANRQGGADQQDNATRRGNADRQGNANRQDNATQQGNADRQGDADRQDDATRQGNANRQGNADQQGGADASADGDTAERSDAPARNQRRGGGAMNAAERQAVEGGGGASAAASNEETEASDVTSETVTEETARSSDEDFASGIEREAKADDDDGGLSKLEKALLLGAGALAVGAILKGNREVVASSDDRVVVSGADGGYQLLKDDNALLARPGTDVQTETFDDGSTRSTVTRQDGSRIVTIRDADLRVLRRTRIAPDGERYVFFDDTVEAEPVDVASLAPRAAGSQAVFDPQDQEALRRALAAEQDIDRSFSLAQIRNIAEVRDLVPAIDLDSITFESGSAAISPDEADELTALGQVIRDEIDRNPRELFLIEGHTDAVGDPAYNLALSDRRAESVALALTEYFDVPPENLVVQGYGERFLKIGTEEAERQNRRATVRRITPLLQMAAAN